MKLFYTKIQALGFKHKRKTLEEVLRSTSKKVPELIGFDEDPVAVDNFDGDSITLDKLRFQEEEETPSLSNLPKTEASSSHSILSSSPQRQNTEKKHEPVGWHQNGINGLTESGQLEMNGTQLYNQKYYLCLNRVETVNKLLTCLIFFTKH